MRNFFNLLVIVTVGCAVYYLYSTFNDATMADELPLKSYDPDSVSIDSIPEELIEPYVAYSFDLIEQWEKEEKKVEVEDDKSLVGDWFTPHSAPCPNIFFRGDMTFSMWDWDYGNDENIYSTGTYEVKGDSVYLHHKSGAISVLRHWKAVNEDENYYLSDGDGEDGWKYWLVKRNYK